jgi:hypothetical protein
MDNDSDGLTTVETLAGVESGLPQAQALYREIAATQHKRLADIDAEIAAADAIESITRERASTVRLLREQRATLLKFQELFNNYAALVADHLSLLEAVRQKMAKALVEDRAMSDLYETDIVHWSEEQATLLRGHALTLDWDNLAEEIESVGREERRAVSSALMRGMQHKLYLLGWPNSMAVRHWEIEVRAHLADAAGDFRESMRKHMTLPRLYRRALLEVERHMLDEGPSVVALPDVCPWTLDELLAEGETALRL